MKFWNHEGYEFKILGFKFKNLFHLLMIRRHILYLIFIQDRYTFEKTSIYLKREKIFISISISFKKLPETKGILFCYKQAGPILDGNLFRCFNLNLKQNHFCSGTYFQRKTFESYLNNKKKSIVTKKLALKNESEN